MGVGMSSVATSGAAWEEVSDPEGSGAGPRLPPQKGKELSPTLDGRAGRVWPHCPGDQCSPQCAKQKTEGPGEWKDILLIDRAVCTFSYISCILTTPSSNAAEEKAEVVSFVVPDLTQTVWTAGPARSSEVAMPELSTWWKSEKPG